MGSGVALVVYSPLTGGSYGGTPSPKLAMERVPRDEEEGPDETALIHYEHGEELAVDFTVRNNGPWGVTIMSATAPMPALSLYRVTRTEMGFADPSRCCVEAQPFRPFALHPGEERLIRLKGVLEGCGHYVAGGGVGWDRYRIRYQILGVHKTADVEPLQAIEIRIPDGYVCPESRS